ncbi:ATP-dependent helicase, partial [Paramuribaculum intestinale]
MTEDYLQQLNGQQRAAVEYVDGPSLVIAGAGSGKTRVLTYKIVHLLRCGYEPWRILALTFTNKAAREMRERIEALVGTEVASRLWMGTFHSIFARILRANADRIGFKSSFTIYDSADSKSLVKTIVKDLALDEKIYKPSSVISAISTAKNALISPEKYAADREIMRADADARRPRIHEIYRIYRDRCFTAGAMDFDDLLYYTNVLLRDNPDVLRHYQEFFRYVLVDEYQDTNFAQHLIVARICEEHHQLCVVGDDAQSIYSFRGANIRNILSMRDTYPGMKLFKLERNYRSTQNIINAANSLIEKNTEQIRKEVYSENKPGDRIEVVSSYSDLDESAIVANRISQVRMLTHDSYDEFAILYRTNAQSRILEESLRKRNIPYRIYGGLSFYQRKEVKDAVAYFRLAVNPDDDEALRRVINFPARGIGETTVNKVARTAMDCGVSMMAVLHDPDGFGLEVHSGTRRKLAAFASMVDRFAAQVASGDDALAVASEIIRATGLLSMLITDRTPESISKQENLNELLAGVKEFTEMRREEGEADLGLAAFLGQISLATDQDSDDATEERVTLMTVHAAKGLEFNNVFIVGVEEDLFPSSMAQGSQSEIEEERRLL